MQWWLWFLVGLALLAVEVVVPGGIILLFFGAAAIVLGALGAIGLAGPVWFQWLLFSFLSVVSLLTLRSPILDLLKRRHGEDEEVDSLVGRPVVLLGPLKPGQIGKAELRGTSWSVQSGATETLNKGQRCIVESVDGLKLHVRAE